MFSFFCYSFPAIESLQILSFYFFFAIPLFENFFSLQASIFKAYFLLCQVTNRYRLSQAHLALRIVLKTHVSSKALMRFFSQFSKPFLSSVCGLTASKLRTSSALSVVKTTFLLLIIDISEYSLVPCARKLFLILWSVFVFVFFQRSPKSRLFLGRLQTKYFDVIYLKISKVFCVVFSIFSSTRAVSFFLIISIGALISRLPALIFHLCSSAP